MTSPRIAFAVVCLLALAVAGPVLADDQRSDFALFDGTNPDNGPDAGAVCTGRGAFTYHVAVANFGSDGEVRITYADGDFIRFPIAAGASFAFSQAAGGKGKKHNDDPDRAVRVSNGGSAAQLAGAMSALGKHVTCISCDATADGDAACDQKVPN